MVARCVQCVVLGKNVGLRIKGENMPAKWQLKQMFQRAGQHLPKRVKAELYAHVPIGQFRPGWYEESKLVNNEPAKGNLENDEYRYFMGCKSEHATFAKCRICEQAFVSHLARRGHSKASDCMRTFNIGLNVWLGTKRQTNGTLLPCAACHKDTLNRKWGIPLCLDTVCMENWKFGITLPKEFKEAIVRMMGA